MATFGRCPEPAGNTTPTAAGRHYGDKYTLVEDGEVTSMAVWCDSLASAATIRLTIYDDDGAAGVQGTLLGYTDDLVIPGGGAKALRSASMIAPVALTAGDYWLCWQAADVNGRIYFDTGAEQYRGTNGGDPFADGPANPFSGASIVTGDRAYAICATYTVPAPPVNTVAPVASGSPVVGQTLSVTDGTWTGDAPITFTYQWQRDGGDIGGATANTYLLTAADVGAMIRCVVTGTNAAGNSDANSNALGPVTAAGGGRSGRVAPTFLLEE
jgi:hypothetical protein